MKTNELMGNDWVYYNDEPCLVRMVDYQYNHVRCHHNGNEWICGTEEINPIELSDKILLDSGFKIVYDSSVSMKCYATNGEDSAFIYLSFCKKSDGKINLERIYLESELKITTNTIDINININFVHELQHILRIFGLNDIDNKIKVR